MFFSRIYQRKEKNDSYKGNNKAKRAVFNFFYDCRNKKIWKE